METLHWLIFLFFAIFSAQPLTEISGFPEEAGTTSISWKMESIPGPEIPVPRAFR